MPRRPLTPRRAQGAKRDAPAIAGASDAWPSGQPDPGYAAAIEALDRPGLFETRACDRLLSLMAG